VHIVPAGLERYQPAATSVTGFLTGILLMLAGASPALADAEGDFSRGYEAYGRQDYAQALSLWRKAAEQGHARAQNGIGVLYRDGLGTVKNERTAAKWFRDSAEKGYAFAMFNLGVMYRDGRGVARDEIEAYKWLTLASTVHYDEEAAVERDRLARRMSAQQKDEARARAQAWLDRFFFGASSRKPKARQRVPATE
jgi:hypothetical protein